MASPKTPTGVLQPASSSHGLQPAAPSKLNVPAQQSAARNPEPLSSDVLPPVPSSSTANHPDGEVPPLPTGSDRAKSSPTNPNANDAIAQEQQKDHAGAQDVVDAKLTDEHGRPDGGLRLLLNGYWPKVEGRPWVFDDVQAPNAPRLND